MQNMIGGEEQFWIGLLIGFLLGSLVTGLYCKRKIKSEIRERYIQLSIAQAQIESLEKNLQQRTVQQIMAPTLQNPRKKKGEAQTLSY